MVIPTKDRESRLAFALDALAGQTIDPGRFEVIVVRASDQPPQTTSPGHLKCRFLTLEGSTGAGAQRNLGWRAAKAPLVAFTDDDCRPAPAWLERVLAAFHGDEGSVLQGRTDPDPDERGLLRGLARSISIQGPSPWFETCNIVYPKGLLERLGGFDESFPGAWGEDTDLGLRAQDAGASIRYVESAHVWHAVNPRSPGRAVSEALARDTIAAVVARHPRQRKALYLRVFARHAHGRLLLAAAGGIALRRRPLLAILFLIPYASRYRNPRRGLFGVALGITQLPIRAPIDAVEVVAMARASVRHRTLVL